VQHVRIDHGAERELLQVRELRIDERLRVISRLNAKTRSCKETGFR
jgi:hypothetical protein